MTSPARSLDVLPLAEFLATLASVGIKPTLAEYDRLALVLRGRGPWDLEKLRAVLAALLAKNPEQLEGFDRLFDDFFTVTDTPGVEAAPEPALKEQEPPGKPRRLRGLLLALALLTPLGAATLYLGFSTGRGPEIGPQEVQTPEQDRTPAVTPRRPETPAPSDRETAGETLPNERARYRIYPGAPSLGEPRMRSELPPPSSWVPWSALVAALGPGVRHGTAPWAA